MKTKITFIILMAVLLITSLTACEFEFGFNWDDFKYRYDDTLTGDLTGAEEFEVTIRNGRIIVETWDKDEVHIDIEVGIKASSQEIADEMADEIKLKGSLKGKTYQVEIDYGEFLSKKKRYACHITVKVPKRIALKLATTNGSIEVEEMENQVVANTTNGSIEVDGTKGLVDLSTTNGSIHTMNIDGRIDASSTNGKLNLHSLNGDVQGSTTNGRIVIMVENPLDGNISAGTTNGSIEVSLAAGSEFDIRASTTNGNISDDVDGGNFDYNKRRTSMSGNVGSDNNKVNLSTTNGSIKINME